ncbi:MAG: GvpL/GvpF family gas vesicle protein [Longimicrobiales bacterium]
MKDETERASSRARTRFRKRQEAAQSAAGPTEAEAAEDAAPTAADGASGFYLFGVVRAGRRAIRSLSAPPDVTRIQFRDLEALARPAPFAPVRLDDDALQAHQRAVETAMRGATILPMPFGIVFRGRRALIGFLQDQYLALDDGLSFLEGHWEIRLHLTVEHGERTPEMADMAAYIYAELRRGARAALPFRRQGGDLFGAAFLVERDAWIRFVEKADELVHSHPDLTFDVTGPWPPYDFVRLVR